MNELLLKYEEYLKYELNYSLYTIKEYFLHINKYLDYLKKNNLEYEKIKKSDVIGFLKMLDEEKLSNKTIANILSSLRNFYDYLQDQNIVETNVFRLIKNPKIEKRLPNFLSYESMREIFDTLLDDTFLNSRDKLIIELLYATGMRVSELVNLKYEDIDYNNKSIKVLGKGRKERIVYFGSPCLKALEQYKKVNEFASDYVILNKYGKKITTRGVELIINKICDMCAIKGKVSPHTFRHTFATHLLQGGADIKSVGELLGHNSLNTTEIYTHITSDYLKSEYLKNMPRK